MYRKFYSEFLKHHQDKLHFAAHSHHFWPDVTKKAQIEYWDDSARLTDEKWGHVFGTVIPETQKLIAQNLNLKHTEMITFAPNTHELVSRLLSALDWTKEVCILTTDSEFHSFKRQAERLLETGKLKLDLVATEPFNTLEERLSQKIKSNSYDLIFLSQVFFNSGVTLPGLQKLVALTPLNTIFVLDGYHAFMALPTDLSKLEGRIFYLAGAYKYAQGGEGASFMISPKDCTLRPLNTGWFASFSTLEKKSTGITYDQDAYRFMGSTFDPSGIYRLRSVLKLFHQENLTVEKIHQYISSLQTIFLSGLKSKELKKENLLRVEGQEHGHFLTFKLESDQVVKSLHDRLRGLKVMTDYRGDRWRFGFGLYHHEQSVTELLGRIDSL